jgi:pimeloyl-ACP methyl ester carboxylesterase
MVSELQVAAGVVDYEDTGGDGPVIVFLHGLVMDSTVWRHVVDDLRADYRCVLPTLPLGAHRRPMRPDADLSLRGLGELVAEFIATLGLTDVTLVGVDWGGAQLLVDNDRVSRLILVACEAFDNYPPGLPGRVVKYASMIPGGIYALAQPLRIRSLRRLPIALGMLSKRPIPADIVDNWLRPLLSSGRVRRDLARYARVARKAEMVAVTERLRTFNRPALVVWATEDRMMPPDHGRRLAELLPKGRLVEIADSYTLIPEDQPAELTRAVREFLTDTA